MKLLLPLLGLLIFSRAVSQTPVWPYHKQAVIVLTYDDGLVSQLDNAVPQLNRAGFKATFFLTGDTDSSTIPRWRALAGQGFELGNHTLYHPCSGSEDAPVKSEQYTPDQMVQEIRLMNNMLFAIDGRNERTYAYPCTETVVGGKDYVDTLRNYGLVKYARIGGDTEAVITDFTRLDPLRVPAYGLEDSTSAAALIAYVKKVQACGGMGIIMFHGIGGDYITTSTTAHQQLLDYLKKNRNTIWVTTFQKAMNYAFGKTKPTSLSTPRLSVQNMQSDLDILWSTIQSVHPGYGIYMSKDSLRARYRAARASIDAPMSESGYISHIYPFLCGLGCGHTQITHSAGFKPDPMDAPLHLPFDVLVQGQKARVTTTHTPKLSTGDEIISINGVPAASLIREGYSLYCGDGYGPSFRELYLSEYDGFEDVCNLRHHWAPPYHMTVRTDNQQVRDITLDTSDVTAAIGSRVIENKYAGWKKAEGTGDLGLYFYPRQPLALLEVHALSYGDTLMYGKCFETIAQQNTKTLILDMRHNGGGDLRIAIRLMSYLAKTDFGIIKDLYARLPDPSVSSSAAWFDPERTENFKDICIPAQSTQPTQTTHPTGRIYHMNIRPAFGGVFPPLHPAGTNRFGGKLIVLIDGATFSSAALFVSALKAQRDDVTFVGRETAGAEEGCNGFAMQRLTLPYTHVVVEFPWLRVVSMARAPKHGRGLTPDHPVNYTPQEVVTGSDPDLKKALTLAE